MVLVTADTGLEILQLPKAHWSDLQLDGRPSI